MYSIGIDAAKGKSTVCILRETGECVLTPRDFKHAKDDLEDLHQTIQKLTGGTDVRIVMEATGIYHWPVLLFLKKNGYFVSVINPLRMKLFAKSYNFRGIKTDKYDSTIIAAYGCEKWFSLQDYSFADNTRDELKRLARSYVSYQKPKIAVKQALDLKLEKCMPGIKKILTDDQKMYDFILYFRHYDKITSLSQKKFLERFDKWAKKKGYRFHSSTVTKIYELASSGIPTVPFDDSCVLIVESLVNTLVTIDKGLNDILTRMHQLASSFPEYDVVLNMSGVGYILAPLIIAEFGDIRLYRSKKSLVCAAGIDVPPYESGQFKASHRVITKKGNSNIRRHLYLVMNALYITKPKNDSAVYEFMIKKQAEGKLHKQVIVAGMRKFLHIYYARVKERYQELGLWETVS
jgi:transposase